MLDGLEVIQYCDDPDARYDRIVDRHREAYRRLLAHLCNQGQSATQVTSWVILRGL